MSANGTVPVERAEDGDLAQPASHAAEHDQVDTVKDVPLEELPAKRRGLSALTMIFAAGTALFSDGYVNASSGPAMTILTTYIYGPTSSNPIPKSRLSHFKEVFSALVFTGTVLGMLVFGFAVDRLGRKFGMVFASVWLTLWSVIIAGAWGAHTTRARGSDGGLFAALQAMRFLQGIAIGAEYPSGSVAASENSESPEVNKDRQQVYFILATNTMIDLGFVIAPLVAMILYYIFGMNHLQWVWRLTLGLGAIPPLLVLPYRFMMFETDHFRRHSIRTKVPWLLIFRKYGLRLATVSAIWFIYDYVSYPASIYSSLFTKKMLGDSGTLGQTFGWSCMLNVFYLPGTIGGAFVTQKIGPKNTIIIGTATQGVLAFIMAGAYSKIATSRAALVIVYGLFLMFGELGLGNNLGLVASKSIAPTAVRGTFYGIAAAIGKLGAFSGDYAYPLIQTDFSSDENSDLYNAGPFYVAGAMAFGACLITLLLLPQTHLDGMDYEDREFKSYLLAHGYDTSHMGDTSYADDVEDKKDGHVQADTKDLDAANREQHY